MGRVRSGLATLAVLLSVVCGGVAANAAEPPEQPIITFQGSVTVNTVEGDVYVLSSTLTVDCTDDPCTAITSSSDGTYTPSLTNGLALPLQDGATTVPLPEFGDLCTLQWIGAGDLSIVVSDTTAAISRGSAAGAPRGCSDGSTAEAAAASISGTLAYQSGTLCLIDASCPAPTATPAATVSPTATADPTIGELVAWPDEPSSLSQLAPPKVAINIPNLLWAGAGALILVLLISFPSVLLDSATERLTAWFDERRMRRTGQPRRAAAAPPLTVIGLPLALLGLIVAALASAYVDPDFGYDLVGARTVISVVVSYLAAIAVGWGFVALIMAGGFPGSRPRMEFRPLTLLIVAAAVIFSRLTGFEPGIIFGLIAGIGFATVLSAGVRAFASMMTVLYLFGIAAAGWIGYGLVGDLVSSDPTWGETLALETLAAVAITGASALPIALLPVRGLTGHIIWRWSRWAWALSYLVAVAGFLLVLMPLPDSWQQVGIELWAWISGFVAYSVGAVLIWLIVVRPWRRTNEAA